MGYTHDMTAANNEARTRRVRRSIIIIGILVLVAGAFGGWLRTYNKRSRAADLAGSPLQRNIAVVETLVARQGSAVGMPEVAPWALVRFKNELFKVPVVVEPQRLRERAQAQITFRIGKSGRIYVETVGPLSAVNPSPLIGNQAK